jgi:hypothetical protein
MGQGSSDRYVPIPSDARVLGGGIAKAHIIGAMRSQYLPVYATGWTRLRVTGPIGDSRSIRIVARWRMGQVGGERVTFGLTRLGQTERRLDRVLSRVA